MKIRHPLGALITLVGCVIAAYFLIQIVRLPDYLTDLTLSEEGRAIKQQMKLQMMQQQQQQAQ